MTIRSIPVEDFKDEAALTAAYKKWSEIESDITTAYRSSSERLDLCDLYNRLGTYEYGHDGTCPLDANGMCGVCSSDWHGKTTPYRGLCNDLLNAAIAARRIKRSIEDLLIKGLDNHIK